MILASLVDYSKRHLFYGGAAQPSISGHTFVSINPATAQTLAEIQTASHDEIDAAISSARRAFSTWAAMPTIQRSRILHRAAAILRSRNDQVAKLETLDTGKPFSETSTVDVITGADVLEYYANLVGGGGLNGETVQLRESVWCYTSKEPLGVCVGIGAVCTVSESSLFSIGRTEIIGHVPRSNNLTICPMTLSTVYTERKVLTIPLNISSGIILFRCTSLYSVLLTVLAILSDAGSLELFGNLLHA